MEITIREEKENPLLNRIEIIADISHNGATPRKLEVRDKIAALKDVDKLTVVVDRLVSKFGARESTAFIKIYKTREDLLKYENKARLKKFFTEEELKEIMGEKEGSEESREESEKEG